MAVHTSRSRALGVVAFLVVLVGAAVLSGVPGSSTAPTSPPGGPPIRAVGDGSASPWGSPTASTGTAPASGSVPAPALDCALIRPAELLPTRTSELTRDRACAAQEAANHAPDAPGAPGWVPVVVTPPGFEAYNQELTYDSADGYLLLFGSAGGTGPLNGTETWTYSGGNWSQLHPAVSPESCPSSALAYDSVDGYVVYFGGGGVDGGNCSSTAQTWEFSAGHWTQLHPTVSPSARDAASFTNDSQDGYLLLFGGLLDGPTDYQATNQTWTFAGGNWNELFPAVAPSPRASAGLTFDATDGYVVLFGGATSGGDYQDLNDTWSYSAGVWTRLNPTSHPISPWPDGLAYDASDRVTVYTSAENLTQYSEPEQVWTFAGGNWTRWIAGAGNTGVVPPNRLAESTAYDWGDGCFVLFGGIQADWTPLNDFWSFHAGNWTNRTSVGPSAREGAAGVYDPADGYFVLFGGQSGATLFSDTWAWAHGTWTELVTNQSPPARSDAGMTYDAADGYVLLFGGRGAGGNLNDSWEFTDGGWTEITPAVAPPATLADQDLVYDAADGYVVLLDTGGGTSTWSYHAGVWQDLTGSSHPAPPVPTNGLVYDAVDGRVVLFGTEVSSGVALAVNDTWTFLNGNWTNITTQVGASPAATWNSAITYDANLGYVLLFNDEPWSGDTTSIDTWTFVADHWTQQYSPLSPQSRSAATLGYDAASKTDLLFGGYETAVSGQSPPCQSNDYCGDTWVWAPGGAATPTIVAFTATPDPVDVGETSSLMVQVDGGVAPYTYSYSGLPSSCSSANTSELNCTPSAPGGFTVTVTVTDSAGNSTVATLNLAVAPDLSIVSFYATPNPVTLGTRTLLSVTTVNGSAPVGYSYTGLPGGCVSQTVPTLPCTPGASGTFEVTVTATDHSGSRASAELNLTVTPAGTGSGPRISSYGLAPETLDLGNSTTLFLNATGAVAVAYAGLPAGCLSANETSLLCTPTAAGVYAISFFAVAGSGPSLSVEANLTVFPVGGGGAALISAFGASPGVVTQGSATVVTVLASGGTGPLSYSYPSLPPGCSSSDTDALPCTPSEAGQFTITVLVTDAHGNRTGARGLLTVVPGVMPGNPSGPLANPPLPAYVDWIVGAVVGLAIAVGVTDTLLRRRRLHREGDDLVRALNETADEERPPPPPG